MYHFTTFFAVTQLTFKNMVITVLLFLKILAFPRRKWFLLPISILISREHSMKKREEKKVPAWICGS